MKRSMTTKLFSILGLAAILGVGGAWASPIDPLKKTAVDPKTPNASIAAKGITASLGTVQLDPALVKINKRAPIAFKAFDMVDKTGKKIAAGTMIDLPNGKKARADVYFADLNKLEKKFNDLGYTLRDTNGGKAVLLQQSIVDEQGLAKQAKTLTLAHAAFNPKTMAAAPTPAQQQAQFVAGVKGDPSRLKDLVAIAGFTNAAKTVQSSRQFSYMVGNKSLAAAYLNGNVAVTGTKDSVTVSGNSAAGGYLINREINLIRANGSVTAPAQGKSTASLHVYLLGQHVINVDKSSTATLNLTDTKSQNIDVHADFHVTIGPIPVTVKLGARGSAGVRYGITVRPAHATFQVAPFVDAKVYAQVGVDLYLVSGGAGGELTLLKDELVFGAEIGLDFNRLRGPSITEHVYAQNKMTMLSGRVYAWVKVNYLFGSHEWDYDIFKWSGLQTNGYLFNIQDTTYLMPTFQAGGTGAINAQSK